MGFQSPDFAAFWSVALKHGRIVNFDVFCVVIGFNRLIPLLYEYCLAVINEVYIIVMFTVMSAEHRKHVNFHFLAAGCD